MSPIKEADLDLRVRRTRRMLTQAFVDLLSEKNFQSITVQDITSRAMVNRATFYDHFVDKYALLQYSINEWFQETLNNRLHESSGWNAQNLQQLVLTTCEFLFQLHHHCQPIDHQMLMLAQSTITDGLTQILESWARESDISITPDPSSVGLVATVTSWSIFGAASFWVGQDRKEPVEAYVDRVMPVLFANLSQSV